MIFNLPEEYVNLSVAFSKTEVSKLLPHCAYDCAIDLLPDSVPPKGSYISSQGKIGFRVATPFYSERTSMLSGVRQLLSMLY